MDDGTHHGAERPRLEVIRSVPAGSRVLRLGPRAVVNRIQDAVEVAIAAVYTLRGALSALDDGLPAHTGLVRTPLGIVCAPDEPRCVALTVRGTRCANPVFDTPAWSGGVLAALHERAAGFPDQLCRVHRRKPPDRTVAVEWFIVADASLWAELLYL